MGHHCSYSSRIEILNDKIVYMLTAYYKDKSEDVYYEELVSGKQCGRYIRFNYIAGYLVDFPGEKVKFYGGNYIQKIEDFEEYCEMNPFVGIHNNNQKKDLELIQSIHPDLKYFLKKFYQSSYREIDHKELFKVIRQYWKHPEIEPLIQYNQLAIAMNNNLYRLSSKKLKEVIQFIKENWEKYPSMNLKDVLCSIKNKIPYKLVDTFRKCKENPELFQYLLKQKESIVFYEDYIRMVKKAGHNLEDRYWKYPNHLRKAHAKVVEECKNIDNALNVILNAQFEIVANKLKRNEKIIGGNHYYIVQDFKDFSEHANALKQCLITSGYMEKFIKQQSILIFIKDSNLQSIGTVEINYSKKILQAYGNELDRTNCKLPQSILDDANEYIKQLKIRKHSFKYELPKNCYFKGLYDNDKSFNGLKFEVGKTYQTTYDDETILKNQSKCLASNKVYHFCKNVQDVTKWVSNPASFAIVEALGPVVQNGTAFGSNKIKIKRITTIKDIATSLLAINKAVVDVCHRS